MHSGISKLISAAELQTPSGPWTNLSLFKVPLLKLYGSFTSYPAQNVRSCIMFGVLLHQQY